MSRQWRIINQAGASLFEFFVALAVIGIIASVLFHRMLQVQEVAEMTAMEMTVAHMQTGLRYKTADLLMRDRVSEIAALADENPIDWLDTRPQNYLGEFDGSPETDPRGNWYFDRTRHEIVYTPNHRRHFLPDFGQNFAIRWRAMRSVAHDARVASDQRSVQWVALIQLSGGKWF